MDELEATLDLGPENDQHLRRLRRALILGTGFQLIFVEVSQPNLKQEVLRRLRLWSGTEGVPTLVLVRTRPDFDPAVALQDVASGAVLIGIDDPFDAPTAGSELMALDNREIAARPDIARSEAKHPIEQAMTTLNWYRDQLPSLVNGPLVLVLSPDGLRQLFVHAPDLLAWRSHTTRITTPRPTDLELRPWPN